MAASKMDVVDILEESSNSYSSYSSTSTSSLLEDKGMVSVMNEQSVVLQDRVANLKKQYWYLKEMYNHETSQLMTKKHEKLVSEKERQNMETLGILKDRLQLRLKTLDEKRELQRMAIQRKYEAEEQAIRQNFENEKEKLYETIKKQLEEKIRKLSAKQRLVEDGVNDDNDDENHSTGKNYLSTRKEPQVVNGPFIVYQLHDDEIAYDCFISKKALKNYLSR